MPKTILICDDEKNIRSGLAMSLEMDGYATMEAADGREAWDIINHNDIALVISDLRMPNMSGDELLKKIVSAYPTVPVVMLTGHGTVEDAVAAMRDGAVDFFTKPVDLDKLSLVVKKSIDNSDLAQQNEKLKSEISRLKARDSYTRMVGKSPALTHLMETITQVAPSNASVLVTGESGVGKALVAEALHNMSSRRNKPMVTVQCAALPDNLLESELFGHEKGAFTGAVSRTKGRFELSDGGTIFLDEIGEISQATQVKLLRVLQEREFERVGGQETIKVDVRVIAATNRDLYEEVKKGNFREDLYYRLNVVHLEVPPLRERRDDIPLLAMSFLTQFAKDNGKKIEGFSNDAKNALLNYSWPGNIRELRNCMESTVVLTRNSVITLDDLPAHMRNAGENTKLTLNLPVSMDEAEKQIIMAMLAYCEGNKTKTAELMGIGRKTLHRKIDEYHIE